MQNDFNPTVYLLASHRNGTLYLGVTSNLLQRLHQHRGGLIEGFTKDYGVHRLVWFEQHATMEHAITREKRIKKWNRAWKMADRRSEPGMARSGGGFGLRSAIIEADCLRTGQEMGSRLRGNDDL